MLKMYGIASCDSIKKAGRWLKDNKVDYIFHDFRKDGIDKKLIKDWMKNAGKDVLINRQSTTWRGLSEADKLLSENVATAVDLVSRYPALVKRPVLDTGSDIIIGFNEDQYNKVFNTKQKLKK